MRLERFRVQNYKKVGDTDWVNVRDLTVFVGKNEAGKSAIFRGLSKLKPSDGEKYDGLKEFPRRRYVTEFHLQDWPVSSAELVLSDEESAALSKEHPEFPGVKKLVATRHYSAKLTVQFGGHALPERPSALQAKRVIESAITAIDALVAPDGKGEALAPIKKTLTSQLKSHASSLTGDAPCSKPQIEPSITAIAQQSNEEWQKQLLDSVSGPITSNFARPHQNVSLPVFRAPTAILRDQDFGNSGRLPGLGVLGESRIFLGTGPTGPDMPAFVGRRVFVLG